MKTRGDKETPTRDGPLAGLRVTEVAHHLAGPLAGVLLADLGAAVVKVEPPGGDPWRRLGEVPGHPDLSPYFLALNGGKRSIVLDLAAPWGRAPFRRLLAASDVVVTNLAQDARERLGLSERAIRRANPRVILAAVEGAPPGNLDLTVQALAGMIRTDEAGRPRPHAVPLNDTLAAALVALVAVAALLERERSSRGQSVAVSLLGAAATHLRPALLRTAPERPVRTTFASAFHAVYETADGHLALAAYMQHLWRAAAAAAGDSALAADSRLDDPAAVVEAHEELGQRLAAALRQKTTETCLERFAAYGVPAAAVGGDWGALLDAPAAQVEGLVETVSDPRLGRIEVSGPPFRLSRTPSPRPRPAPSLGADTVAVLMELGYSSRHARRLAHRPLTHSQAGTSL